MQHLGFVGFGEAAYHIAKGLKSEGVTRISAYDINISSKVKTRAGDTGVDLVRSPADLAAVAEVIISAVTADQAGPAAEQNAPYLTSKHLYCDLNSISPKAKERVAAIASANGARFVEIAVMGPIPPYLHKAPLLIGGAAAPEFQTIFEPLGMRMEIVSAD